MRKPLPEIKGTDVNKIQNRNEKRVAQLMPEIIDEYYADYTFDPLDIEDIYALTLNLLPARYIQHGSIIISDRLSNYEITIKIRSAIERVLDHPTRAEKE